ncbi:Sjogren's syndrome/scleroderma autoantigen 1 family protein [Halosolutus amylolyticus]|uniref:Sjogren's syndrome/scleroderma autoantigen 1 family protein n=1 Tax=Halosolutus amylolyticus TaxID=2932267 RepID=A0ABD5PK92_9EURY|nr:Sjogren's syndrome/scleroderma autoantigen 1 family protein [Halosolutus amylolyticus]
MSDFDKEAEREKLREKYERDKAEREATQRMSDLLLKGATMTNTHCGTCGDPLFQQDGTTFCPSCHGNPDAVEGTDLEAQPAEESAGGDATDEADAAESGDETATAIDRGDGEPGDSASETAGDGRPESARDGTSPAGEATRGFDSNATAIDEPGDGEETTSRSPAETGREARTPSRRDSSGRESSARSAREGTAPSRRSSPARESPAGDLDAAHASLVAALEKFAAEAAEADDPRYARECLEAAREASETLDVLR